MKITDDLSAKDARTIEEIVEWVHKTNTSSYEENECCIRIYFRLFDGNVSMIKHLLKSYYKKRDQSMISYNRWNNIYENLRTTYDIAACGLLPDKSPLGNTVLVMKLLNSNKDINIPDFMMRLLLVIETLKRDDVFWKKGISIIDYTGVPLNLFFKLNLLQLKKLYHTWREFAFITFVEVHHINLPLHAYYIINFINNIIDDKFKKKNYYHTENLDKFYEFIPINILPIDYGGKAPPLEELSEYWYTETMASCEPIIEYFKELSESQKVKNQSSSIFSLPGRILGKLKLK